MENLYNFFFLLKSRKRNAGIQGRKYWLAFLLLFFFVMSVIHTWVRVPVIMSEIFVSLLSSYRKILEYVKSGHDRFLLHTFEIILH